MVNEKTVSDVTESPKNKSLLLILSLVSVVAVVLVGFYFAFQKGSIVEEQKRLDNEIDTLNNEIVLLEGQEIEAAQLAQSWVDIIEEDEVRWSVVLTQIDSLIPYDASAKKDKIEFLSYSGSEGGKLTMNARTRELRVEPFDDVAELIEIFNDSTLFADAYVPSVTRGETDEGRKVASFVFNVTFKDVTLESLQKSVTDAAEVEEKEASDQPKVSR